MNHAAQRVLLNNLLINANKLLAVLSLHAVYLIIGIVLRNNPFVSAASP